MKKVINGKLYNTETAKEIKSVSHGDGPRDFRYYEETLYRKRTGEYFLAGEGGPMTKYRQTVGQNSWRGGDGIIPLSYEETLAWAEQEMDVDEYEAEFGQVDEGDLAHLHISVPASIADAIRKAAKVEGVSVSECIARRFK